ncbi:MAG: pyridoxamine 5'-phosphate oxidase family protein [Candidatus Saccharibacteria bacterium]
MNIEEIVREYIIKTPHMSLATVRDNKPWVCEVHFANDDSLNLYFVSKQATRHCQEIANNPNVAGNIVRQHALTEIPHGIYFEGTAEKLETASNQEIERYCNALGRDVNQVTSQLLEENGSSMYKVIVSSWSTFGKFDSDHVGKTSFEWNGGVK